MSTERRRFGMGRFGRKKKDKPVTPLTDLKLPLPPPSDAPRVLLPHVETQLNMHQYNGLFDSTASAERHNGAVEPPTSEWFFVPLFRCQPLTHDNILIACLYRQRNRLHPSLRTVTPRRLNGPRLSDTRPPASLAVSSITSRRTSHA